MGQRLCPRGNPFAPRTTPLPLGRAQSPWGNSRDPGVSNDILWCLWPTYAGPNFRILRILDPRVSAWVEPAPPPGPNPLDPGPQARNSTQAETPECNPGSGAWGRADFDHVLNMLDRGGNAWVEQKSAMATFCSTPWSRLRDYHWVFLSQ